MYVLAHRGLPGPDVPENTLDAVAAAVAAGADGVEVDLRVTADGVVVLSHDLDLRRTAGIEATIAGSTWAELQRVRLGGGARIPRVRDVLAAVPLRHVVLELKSPPTGPPGVPVAAATLALELAALRPLLRDTLTIVSSFDRRLLSAVAALVPDRSAYRFALLGTWTMGVSVIARRAREAGFDQIHPQAASVVRHLAVHGDLDLGRLEIVPWDVNSDTAAVRLAGLGVHGVITDVPVSLRTAVAAGRRVPSGPLASHPPQQAPAGRRPVAAP